MRAGLKDDDYHSLLRRAVQRGRKSDPDSQSVPEAQSV